MPSKTERSEATRGALLRAARELFAEHGFAATGTEALVKAAGVTRGALYHHFRDKVDVFRAVYEELEAELAQGAVEAIVASPADDPIDGLKQAAETFLDACMDPAVQRIALLEAPAVLGWEEWREIEQRSGLGLVKAGLEGAISSGAMVSVPAEPLAHILLAGLIEAAQLLAHAPNPRAARKDIGTAIGALLEGLRATPP